MTSAYKRETCIHMFITSPFIIAKSWNQPRCPSTDEWIKNDRLFRHKEERNPFMVTRVWGRQQGDEGTRLEKGNRFSA
jgi:hypothetical protein